MSHLGFYELYLLDANEVERLLPRVAEVETLYDYSIQERQRLEFLYLNEVDKNQRLEDDLKEMKKKCMK